MGKILSTSNFKQGLLLLIFCIPLECRDRLEWIRRLPTEVEYTNSQMPKLPLAIFNRPFQMKSPMGNPNVELIEEEWIELNTPSTFKKMYRSFKSEKNKTKITVSEGIGLYKVYGPWVLLEYQERREYSCQLTSAKSRGYLPPKSITFCAKEQSRFYSHRSKLLYHFSEKERSLIPLQYESNFKEFEFGMVWDLPRAYRDDQVFMAVRSKYGKKEFQPHVYEYERLVDSNKESKEGNHL